MKSKYQNGTNQNLQKLKKISKILMIGVYKLFMSLL